MRCAAVARSGPRRWRAVVTPSHAPSRGARDRRRGRAARPGGGDGTSTPAAATRDSSGHHRSPAYGCVACDQPIGESQDSHGRRHVADRAQRERHGEHGGAPPTAARACSVTWAATTRDGGEDQAGRGERRAEEPAPGRRETSATKHAATPSPTSRLAARRTASVAAGAARAVPTSAERSSSARPASSSAAGVADGQEDRHQRGRDQGRGARSRRRSARPSSRVRPPGRPARSRRRCCRSSRRSCAGPSRSRRRLHAAGGARATARRCRAPRPGSGRGRAAGPAAPWSSVPIRSLRWIIDACSAPVPCGLVDHRRRRRAGTAPRASAAG